MSEVIKVVRLKNFYAKFKILTPLEWLDIEVDENPSETVMYTAEVALAVTDWNGQGTVDPLQLLADKKQHNRVFVVSKAIDKTREKLPILKVEERPDCLVLTDKKDFFVKIKNLTILEFLDSIDIVRKKSSDDVRSYFKCESIARVLIDWNGEGAVTPEWLHSNRDQHKYVMAIDIAMSEFFRDIEGTISDDEPILDGSNDNGGDAITPSGVESTRPTSKGFSVSMAGVQGR